jgi:hypothetical protein
VLRLTTPETRKKTFNDMTALQQRIAAGKKVRDTIKAEDD